MAKKRGGKHRQATQMSIDEFRKKFEKLDQRRKKHTNQAIERRRQDVWEMMCQNIPQTEMATLLCVARSTVALDVKYWKDRLARRMHRMKENITHANTELGLTIQKLDSVTAAAFQEYSMSRTAGEKSKFLEIATKTLSAKTRILQESGYLPKAGIEIRARVEKLPTFADRFGDTHPLAALDNATSRHKLLGLAEKILKLANTNGSNPIDIDGVVINSGPADLTKAIEIKSTDDEEDSPPDSASDHSTELGDSNESSNQQFGETA